MKNLLLAFLLIPAFMSAQIKTLIYNESTNGMETPEWEGGNTELEFADINNDGYADLLTMGDHGNPGVNTNQQGIIVYFSDGNGGWNVSMNGDLGYGGIAIGDVNNDGFLDVGYGIHHNYSSTDFGDQIMEVVLGDGSGVNWIPWDDGLASNGETWGMFGTDFADIDNDGDLDMGSISFGCCSGVHVYQNQMDGTWVQSFGVMNGNSGMRFEFGDFNNDGYTDFIVAYELGAVYFGDGTGSFTNMDGNLPDPGGIGYSGPSVGDVDQDGDQDIAFVSTEIEVWGWDQVNENWMDLSGNLTGTSQFQETQLYDFNADGYTDLSAYGDGQFKLWLGDGSGNWTEETSFVTSDIDDCKAFRVGGDVDHNGYPDIAIVAEGGSWPSYQNEITFYKESSPADSLWVKELFPGGFERFYPGTVQIITWVSEVQQGTGSQLSIEYSFIGQEGPWQSIAENIPNSGQFQWIIPNTPSENCHLKYTVTSIEDTASCVSALPFIILGEEILYAWFEADITTGYVPLQVQFTDLSSGEINAWNWDFNGDGMVDDETQNPQYTYEEEGVYTVQLVVFGDTQTDTLMREDYVDALVSGMISNKSNLTNIRVHPNPFTDHLIIHIEDNIAPVIVKGRLFKPDGQPIKGAECTSEIIPGQQQLEIELGESQFSRLPAGIYILEITLDANHSQYLKVIKK